MKRIYILLFFFIFNKICFSIENNINDYLNKKLSLIDIINIALSNNPKIKNYWLNVDISKYSYNLELSEYFPNLSASLSYSDKKEKERINYSISYKSRTLVPSLQVSYLLFNFGGRTADVMKMKYKLNAIKYNTNKYIQDFIYEIIEAYYNLFSSIANKEASIESENLSLEAYNAASLKYKIGLVALTDKLQAETSYMQMKLNRVQAENYVKINKAKLNYILNISPSIDLKLNTSLLDVKNDSFEVDFISLVYNSFKDRDDLKAYYEIEKSQKSNIYSKSVSWLPQINFIGNYSRDNDLKHKHNPDVNHYNLGITAKMEFFTGGRIYNNIAIARKELEITKYEIKDLKKKIEFEAWSAYQDFITAKKSYDTSKKLVESASLTEKTILGKYKNGKSSILDLLDVQASLASAKYELITSRHNYFILRAKLLQVMGKLNIENVKEVFGKN